MAEEKAGWGALPGGGYLTLEMGSLSLPPSPVAESLRDSQSQRKGMGLEHLPLEDSRRGESPFWSLLEWEGQTWG